LTTLIATFKSTGTAIEASQALQNAGFSSDGAHLCGGASSVPTPDTDRGRDEASPTPNHAEAGVITGTAIGGVIGLTVGIAAEPVIGPFAVAAAAGVGAYAGSLVGALVGLESEPAATRDNSASVEGPILTVSFNNETDRVIANDILRDHGAAVDDSLHGTPEASARLA